MSTNLERLRAGTYGREPSRGFAAMSLEQRQEFMRTHQPAISGIKSRAATTETADLLFSSGSARNLGTRRVVATKTVGTQTSRSGSDLKPTNNLNALAMGGKGGGYLSFLQKVYGAESENELVIKFQRELGLEPQASLYDKPVMYRQSSQLQRGLGISRDKCHFGNAMFAKK